jgi:hypothetical protein
LDNKKNGMVLKQIKKQFHLISSEHAGHCLLHNRCCIPHYLCKKCEQGNLRILTPFCRSLKQIIHLLYNKIYILHMIFI